MADCPVLRDCGSHPPSQYGDGLFSVLRWGGDPRGRWQAGAGTHLLFFFFAAWPNAIVAQIHPKVMPVILAPDSALVALPREAA
jgi:hypothetical protein